MKISFKIVGEKDLKALNDVVNDERVSRYLSLIPPVSMKSTQQVWERFRRDGLIWCSVLVEGVIAGAVLLKLNPKGMKNSHVASLGIDIAREYWGKGVGEKAMNYIISVARKKGVKRLELEYVSGNERARRLYEKVGFKREGVRRKAFKVKNRYVDGVTMVRFLR